MLLALCALLTPRPSRADGVASCSLSPGVDLIKGPGEFGGGDLLSTATADAAACCAACHRHTECAAFTFDVPHTRCYLKRPGNEPYVREANGLVVSGELDLSVPLPPGCAPTSLAAPLAPDGAQPRSSLH